jgi:hypothetical protein
VLIRIINWLTERKMPLTSDIVIDLAKKFREAFIKKN